MRVVGLIPVLLVLLAAMESAAMVAPFRPPVVKPGDTIAFISPGTQLNQILLVFFFFYFFKSSLINS